jgi:DNA polymerase-1
VTARLPNIRKLFIPDPGYIICDTDLDRADLQVVVWEANDDDLKSKLREGADIHLENAKDIFGERAAKEKRPLAKAGVHATNYYASPRTLARALGITIKEAEYFQSRWFAAHPGISDWHDSVEASLRASRSVRNPFGFRRYYFDRIDAVLPEALAWIPQSTVAIVTNQGIKNLYHNVPAVDILLQVHDSVVWQIKKALFNFRLKEIYQALHITIPYPDPLTIPVGLKVSESSWGECKEMDWKAVVEGGEGLRATNI